MIALLVFALFPRCTSLRLGAKAVEAADDAAALHLSRRGRALPRATPSRRTPHRPMRSWRCTGRRDKGAEREEALAAVSEWLAETTLGGMLLANTSPPKPHQVLPAVFIRISPPGSASCETTAPSRSRLTTDAGVGPVTAAGFVVWRLRTGKRRKFRYHCGPTRKQNLAERSPITNVERRLSRATANGRAQANGSECWTRYQMVIWRDWFSV